MNSRDLRRRFRKPHKNSRLRSPRHTLRRATNNCSAAAKHPDMFLSVSLGAEVTKPGCGAFAAAALMAMIGVLPASFTAAHAELPLAAKCSAVGNFSLDDRIAGCTAVIESTTGMLQSVIFAHFRRAMFYLQKGEVDLAITDYSRIIEHDPTNPRARLGRASAYRQMRDVDAALGDYTKAAVLDPKDVYVYLGRASAYFANGDIDAAIADYGRALLIHPDNVQAYLGRSFAYDVKDEPDRAIADCNRAIEISPERGLGQSCRGRVYITRGNVDLALADFNQAIQLNQREPRFYVDRATALRMKGEFEQASSAIGQAIELAPKSPHFHRWRGIAHFQAGRLSEALHDFVRSNELDQKNPYTQLWLDLARQKNGQPSQLDEATKRIDMSKWPAPIIRLFLGEITFEGVLKAADEPRPTKAAWQICEAYFYSGELALGQGGRDEAMRLIRLAADTCPRHYFEWFMARAELQRLNTKL